MKKIVILLAVVAAMFTLAPKAAAQDNPFGAGNIKGDVYLGLPHTFSHLVLPPIGVAAEYGIIDFGGGDYGTLAAGGAFDFGLNHYYDYGDSKSLNTQFQVSGFAAYHYFINPSFEVHAKAGLGLYHYGWSGYSWNGLGYYEFAGVSYYISPSFAITAEAGYSALTYLHLGVSFVL